MTAYALAAYTYTAYSVLTLLVCAALFFSGWYAKAHDVGDHIEREVTRRVKAERAAERARIDALYASELRRGLLRRRDDWIPGSTDLGEIA